MSTQSMLESASGKAPLVEMRDVSIAFGGIKAVDHASLDLYPGEVLGCSATTVPASRR